LTVEDVLYILQIMQKILILMVLGLIVLNLAGCAVLRNIAHPFSQPESASIVASLPAYSGLRTRLAVVDFELRTPDANSDIAAGLREMLTSALTQSKRFIIVDRKLLVEKPTEQIPSSNIKPSTELPSKTESKTIGLIVTPSLTEFEPLSSGGRIGVGGGGGAGSGMFGGLLGGRLNKAHIAIDIRVTDPLTSQVISARNIQAQASDISGSLMTGFSGTWNLDANLASYANTPMEKALRICIIEAVRYISEAIPGRYYKY
jgi:curli biogenesis system outer membrane secretion channel CsgG